MNIHHSSVHTHTLSSVACLDQPLIMIRSPGRRHSHEWSSVWSRSINGNQFVQCCTPGWRCMHAYQITEKLLHPCYGCAKDYTMSACSMGQFMGPVLNYSNLFSTAMGSTALGGASDRDHLMMKSRSSIMTSSDQGKHYPTTSLTHTIVILENSGWMHCIHHQREKSESKRLATYLVLRRYFVWLILLSIHFSTSKPDNSEQRVKLTFVQLNWRRRIAVQQCSEWSN